MSSSESAVLDRGTFCSHWNGASVSRQRSVHDPHNEHVGRERSNCSSPACPRTHASCRPLCPTARPRRRRDSTRRWPARSPPAWRAGSSSAASPPAAPHRSVSPRSSYSRPAARSRRRRVGATGPCRPRRPRPGFGGGPRGSPSPPRGCRRRPGRRRRRRPDLRPPCRPSSAAWQQAELSCPGWSSPCGCGRR